MPYFIIPYKPYFTPILTISLHLLQKMTLSFLKIFIPLDDKKNLIMLYYLSTKKKFTEKTVKSGQETMGSKRHYEKC